MSLEYTPDDITVHKPGAIKHLCAPFQSHEAGLPEWIKNSADAYARLEETEGDGISREIILFFTDSDDRTEASIACLDFVGMTSDDIDKRFRHWAAPDAAAGKKADTVVLGGHGNGGKCYMTQMFSSHTIVHSSRDQRRSSYGVPGDSVAFGYVPDPERGKDVPIDSVEEEIARLLKGIALSLADLPSAARRAVREANGFSLVVGTGPKGVRSGLPVKKLIESLEENPQMVDVLRACKVRVIWNGKPHKSGQPLTLPAIEPHSSVPEPRVLEIPKVLADPQTGDMVSTTDDGSLPRGHVTLSTSKKTLAYRSRKVRHSIVFRASSRFIGAVTVPDLAARTSYAKHIYGECHLDALERYKTNERGRLAESPMTRAVEQFLAVEISRLAQEMEAHERRHYDKSEKSRLSEINQMLDRWKNSLLSEMLGGAGVGEAGLDERGLPRGTPELLDLQFTYSRLGRGVYMRPILRFRDSSGTRIRSIPVRWIVDDPNVAVVDELGLLTTLTYGKASVYAETEDGRVRSNDASIEVVHVCDIRIAPEETSVEVGGRVGLKAVCTLDDGSERTDVLLMWSEQDTGVARVSSSGSVFGRAEGTTSVSAFDEAAFSSNEARINVTPASGGSGEGTGKGFPRVLVSGVDPDPDTGEVVEFTPGEPPVWHRDEDVPRHIWWINGSAPMASLFRDRDRGFGIDSRDWRIYHVERIMDVVTQIMLEDPSRSTGETTPDQWFIARGEALVEVQEKAAAELAGFIENGDPLDV